MLAVDRRRSILNSLYREKRLFVADLAARFSVTEETIRRDLEKLEKEGFLNRTYGGAIINRHNSEELPYTDRTSINRDLKQTIAARAAALISEGDKLMIDSTSTSYELLGYVDHFHDLTLISNSARLAADCANSPHHVVTLGGELRKKSMSYCGSFTENNARHFNADLFFFSCRGLALDSGITEATLAEAQVKQTMMGQSARVILLVDHTKFDSTTFVRLCDFDRLDSVVTDKPLTDAWRERFESHGVAVMDRDPT